MKQTMAGIAAAALSAATAQTIHFDAEPVGAAPAGWSCGVTGRGSPHWAVEPNPVGTTPPRVLVQRGSGTFPWCVKDATSFADGFIETKFLPIAGHEDQAGGIVWRFKDGDHYYVARANALENNVSLYYTERGSRKTIKYVDAPVARGQWHTLRVEFAGTRIAVSLDGKRYIEQDDSHIAGAGRIGVWTKADSVTAFADFSYGENK